jgi:CRISPR/Cas system-associated exonuclease Cas4 (RecB family)
LDVIEDTQLKQQFLDKLTTQYSKQKDGLFVTDFTYCIRKAYWRRINPKPLTEKTLNYFVDGNRRHETLQNLIEYRAEVSIQKYGLRGRLDMIGNYPIEIKSTRSDSKYGISPHYQKQCVIYALMTEQPTVCLMVQHINEGVFKFHRITYTQAELQEAEQQLLGQIHLLKTALESKDPKDLPYPEPWECNFCDHKGDCFHA